jgi:hypothetical protein
VLHLLEDRPEELFLAGEVVIQRTLRDSGAGDDLVGGGVDVPVFAEELARGRHERGAGRVALGDPFVPGVQRFGVTFHEPPLTSVPTVCIVTY